MNVPPTANQRLNNQSSVRFVSGSTVGVAYSNIVSIPLTGAVLTLIKSASTNQVTLDSIVMFQLEIMNIGNVETDVMLIDTLPEGTSFIPNSLLLNGTPLPGISPEDGLNVGILPTNTSVTILFQIIVTRIPDSLTLTNEALARYSFQTLDGRQITNELVSNPVTITVSPSLLSLYYYASTNQTFEGDIITFSIQINNAGNGVRNALLSVSLMGDMRFIPGSVVIDGLLTPDLDPSEGMTLPFISSNANILISYQVRVGKKTTTQPLTSDSTLFYLIHGEEIMTRSNQVSISHLSPLLTLTVIVTPKQVTYEDTVTYDVLILNEGDTPLEAVYDIILPSELTNVPGTVKLNGISRPEASLNNGLPLGTLFPKSSTSLTFESKVSLSPNSSFPTDELINRSMLTYTFRLNDGRSVRLTTVSLTPVLFYAPRILLHISASPTFIEVGDVILFEITIENIGNTEADIFLPLPTPGRSNILNGTIHSSSNQRAFTREEIETNTLQISNITPSELIQVNYKLLLKEFQPFTLTRSQKGEVWTGSIKALCTYRFNERVHSFEVVSNVYELIIIEHEE